MNASNLERSSIRNIGRGRRLLVLYEQREPIAESVFVLSVVHGFDATCGRCGDVLELLAQNRPQVVFFDLASRVAQKARTMRLINEHSLRCRLAVLSDAKFRQADWPEADLVIERPVSAIGILERLGELVEPAAPAVLCMPSDDHSYPLRGPPRPPAARGAKAEPTGANGSQREPLTPTATRSFRRQAPQRRKTCANMRNRRPAASSRCRPHRAPPA
ncbi:hypothetical protein [Paraburkholderia sp.]|uniref:hypothetical protein n=1 Tax=Paraburkholderia sp. TaxID=1926495 RepID=UPI002F41214A